MFGHELAADEAQFAILNAQSRLWTLSNAPELLNESGLEYVTVQKPLHALPQESMEDIFMSALKNRPEIDQSLRQLESALLRHYRTKNELLPELDLFAQTYVKGLEGDYDHGEAWNESWDEGDPSYSVGLRLGFPLMNNGAKAREQRKKLEIRQLMNQLDTTVTNILLEAQISYRAMIKDNMAMKRRYAVVESTNNEIESLISRIDYLISKNEEYGSILYRLLDALERLNRAEIEFSISELTYNLSLVQLKSAKGTLVEESGVVIKETVEDDLPVNTINIGDTEMEKDHSPLSLHRNPALEKSMSSSPGLVGLTADDGVDGISSSVKWLKEASPSLY
jgi:outer membrane protein TolC